MSDFLGLGLIIKEQKEKLDWQENIIKACDTTMNELRAEVERLRTENDLQRATLDCYAKEQERLRESLKEILDYDPSFSWEIAHAVLADQGKG